MKPKVIITIFLGMVFALFFLVIFQNSVPNQIARMQKDLPMKIDKGMTLTEVYESEKIFFCVVVLDTEKTKEELQISQTTIEEDKQRIIANIKRDVGKDLSLFKLWVDGVVYVYKNSNGEELFRISMAKSEL